MPKRLSRMQMIMIVAFLAAALYFGFRVFSNRDDGKLRASGTIEAVEVNVSPETSGKVQEALADEGQAVKTGDPILRLDESLLTAQRAVAQSGVDSAHNALLTAQGAYNMAQAQYDAAVSSARAQQGAARLTDWLSRTPGQFDQPLWYFSQDEQITAVQAEVDASQQALQQAQSDLDQVVKSLNNSDFVNAESHLADTRISYLVAKSVHDHAQATGGKVNPDDINLPNLPDFAPAYKIKIRIAKGLSSNSGDVIASAQDALDAAQTELKDSQQAYDALLNTDAADRVLKARAALSVARERHEVALDNLSRLQTGEYSPQVKIAALALDQAKNGLQQAQGDVNQAEANLALLDTQLKKLTVYAPMDGVILTRNVEPGEFVQPGAAAITMADLNELTITVYVPEDRYGEISLGQKATVTVDSFPNTTFTGTISSIADQAEYTPRNVQTVQGRSATVYAVKLEVSDPEGNLKLGMPADVVFIK
ncbi:MAG TPA: efflux RND transporter periplasmic adaptor subunit [Anaerolineales bacterium]|nr:efflux RND transporter periplasmic adaptor subunit [Anaerolineales bacterium]